MPSQFIANPGQLQVIEYQSKRNIIEINIMTIQGTKQGEKESRKYQDRLQDPLNESPKFQKIM